MTGPAIHRRGWCPGALRPMQSGDGLVLRIRPPLSRLMPDQAQGLADLAMTFGAGTIELTNRANLQLRGIGPDLSMLQDRLRDAGLIDPDLETEARRNMIVTPIWQNGDETIPLARELAMRLSELPALPAKFGFVIDTGEAAVLTGVSGDLRIEREDAGIILRADGMAAGEVVTAEEAISRLIDVAQWFARHAKGAARMAAVVAAGILPPLRPDAPPLKGDPLSPGISPFGATVGLAFGELHADMLRKLVDHPIRLTPWRMLLLEGAAMPDLPGLIRSAGDPLLRVDACPGRPACASATVATRDLARRLAPLLKPRTRLHVSGCAKGCARPTPADLTLTGREGRFDLIAQGRAADPPIHRALSVNETTDLIRDLNAPDL